MERLEQIRRAYGLTSKAQVIRAALDLFETLSLPGEFLISGRQGVRDSLREWPEQREKMIRLLLKVDDPEQSPPGLSGGDAPDDGHLGEVQGP